MDERLFITFVDTEDTVPTSISVSETVKPTMRRVKQAETVKPRSLLVSLFSSLFHPSEVCAPHMAQTEFHHSKELFSRESHAQTSPQSNPFSGCFKQAFLLDLNPHADTYVDVRKNNSAEQENHACDAQVELITLDNILQAEDCL